MRIIDTEGRMDVDQARRYLRQLADAMAQSQRWRRLDRSGLVQTTLFELLQSAENLRGKSDGRVKAFCRTALGNNFRDAAKPASVRMEDSLEALIETDPDRIRPRLVAAQPSPESQCARAETSDNLRRALQMLPPQERELVELVYIQEVPRTQVASRLGCDYPTVLAMLQKAETALLALMHH
jgi:RNA polymerase sigma factor (sigma-70 family)